MSPPDRRPQPGGHHPLAAAEVELVLVIEIAAAAVHAGLHRLEALVEKGAGPTHIGHPAAVAETAVAAKILGRLLAAGSQRTGPLMGQALPRSGIGGCHVDLNLKSVGERPA